MRYFFPLHIAVEVNTHFSVTHLHKFSSLFFFFKVCAAKSDKVQQQQGGGGKGDGLQVAWEGGVMPLFIYLFILKDSKAVVHRARANRLKEFGQDRCPHHREELKKTTT